MVTFSLSSIILVAVLFGFIFGLMLMAFDDSKPFALYRRFKCKSGKHTFIVGHYTKVNKYFCLHCKSPRKHPQLRVLDGGKKDLDIKFKF
jgi:hypothetical protein